MKKTLNCTMIAALLIATSFSASPARAGGNLDDIFDNPVLVSSLVTFAPTFFHALSNATYKEVIVAQQFSEDAAFFFQSGEMSGILPAVIHSYRMTHSDQQSDADIIDAFMEEAERVLTNATH